MVKKIKKLEQFGKKTYFIYFTNTKYKYCNDIKMISGVNNLIKKLKQINYETDNKPR